jgi:hypothetical protein
MTTTLPPLRCVGLKQAVLSDDGRAVLLELAMANGKIFPLELEAGGVDLLLRALFMSARALGEAGADGRAALDALPPEAPVQLAADAAAVSRAAGDAPARLLLRVGSVDLAVALPGAASPQALARALDGAA